MYAWLVRPAVDILRHPLAATAVIVVLWAVATLPGLNAVGLVNWQESARALAASEMQDRGDWVVPTIAGKPYLAKPPMIYWCQLLLAKITGSPLTEHHLRWTVALAGLAASLLTFFAARGLLSVGIDRPEHEDRVLRRDASLWAAAFVATGVLTVRSSRIGELDILLVPFTIVAVWLSSWAWLTAGATRAVRWLAISGATLAAAGAALTKGPPGLIAIAVAVGGGIMLARSASTPVTRRQRITFAGFWGILVAFATIRTNGDRVADFAGWFGALMLGLMVAFAAAALTGFTRGRTLGLIVRDWMRSGIGTVIAGGLVALWLWTRAVRNRVGPELLELTATQEAADNLRPLTTEAPLQNIEAVAYGVGVGSIAMIAAVAWLVIDRPRIARAWWVLIAWVGLGLLLFSVSGRGTGRYLTPLWPGVAMLGAIWLVRAVRDLRRGRTLGTVAAVAVVALAALQGWWYAVKRPGAEGARSPREFMAELLEPARGVDPSRLAVVDYWVGSLDVYAGHHVEPVTDLGPWIDYPHEETTMADFADRLRRTGETCTLIIRGTPADDPARGPVDQTINPIDHLATYGLIAEEIPISAPFRIDRQKTLMKAVRVRPAPAGS
ncbi:MAG: hypothetical protein GIKADHBN_01167 [Phycisphaerales bacterium]|nr:hypothetical protein [Phycisphaerales bacterium]